MSEPIYINAISSELGIKRTLDSILDESNKNVFNGLVEAGVKHYREFDCDYKAYAKRCLDAVLDRSQLNPEEIGLVFFSSQTKAVLDEVNTMAGELLSAVGMVSAYPCFITGNHCANLYTSLNVAASQLVSSGYENALVVSVDYVPSSSHRIGDPPMAIWSDACSSVVLSKKPRRDSYRIVNFAQVSKPEWWNKISNTSFLGFLDTMKNGVNSVIGMQLDCLGITQDDICCLLTNNYTETIMQMLCMASGFDVEKLSIQTLADVGHAFSSDLAINLECYLNVNDVKQGGKILMLATGPYMWGSVVIEKV